MLTVIGRNNGRDDESYVALRGDDEAVALQGGDEAGFAFQDLEMELPLAEVSTCNNWKMHRSLITGTVGTIQHDLSHKTDSYAPCRPKHDMSDGGTQRLRSVCP